MTTDKEMTLDPSSEPSVGAWILTVAGVACGLAGAWWVQLSMRGPQFLWLYFGVFLVSCGVLWGLKAASFPTWARLFFTLSLFLGVGATRWLHGMSVGMHKFSLLFVGSVVGGLLLLLFGCGGCSSGTGGGSSSGGGWLFFGGCSGGGCGGGGGGCGGGGCGGCGGD